MQRFWKIAGDSRKLESRSGLNVKRIAGVVLNAGQRSPGMTMPVQNAALRDLIACFLLNRDDQLAGICKVNSVPSRVFGGRITQELMPEAEYKMIADMYVKIGGPAGNWDNLNRMECLKLGKEIFSTKA